jgi:hypothetical protein
VAGGDGRLELVGAGLREPQSRVEKTNPLTNLVLVPAVTVLLLQGHQGARPVDTGRATGVVEKHEGEQAQRLGLVGHELGERSGQADRLGAQALPHEVGA